MIVFLVRLVRPISTVKEVLRYIMKGLCIAIWLWEYFIIKYYKRLPLFIYI